MEINKKVLLSFEHVVDITIDYFEPYLGSILQTIDFEKVIFFEIINSISNQTRYTNSLFKVIDEFFIPSDVKKEFSFILNREINSIISKIKDEVNPYYQTFKIFKLIGYNILVNVYDIED